MSVFQDFIKPTLVLAVICLVISFALAKTYSITQPIIDRLAIETANAARAEVLPGASDFEQLTVANMPEGGLDAYRATDGSGYVITTVWKGYGGTIKVMFGMDANGVITGAKVLENSETAGLGTKACDPRSMPIIAIFIHLRFSSGQWRPNSRVLWGRGAPLSPWGFGGARSQLVLIAPVPCGYCYTGLEASNWTHFTASTAGQLRPWQSWSIPIIASRLL